MKQLATNGVAASGAPHRNTVKAAEGAAVDHVGIRPAILTERGEVIDRGIRTERHRLGEVFGRRPKAKVLIEASTESEWWRAASKSSVMR